MEGRKVNNRGARNKFPCLFIDVKCSSPIDLPTNHNQWMRCANPAGQIGSVLATGNAMTETIMKVKISPWCIAEYIQSNWVLQTVVREVNQTVSTRKFILSVWNGL